MVGYKANNMKKLSVFFVLLIGLGPLLFAQNNITQDERMQWWREARFGMFVHWGVYSIPAGEWKGKQYGSGEWIMKHAQIPVEEYRKLASEFNPVKFNAHDFVATAKSAGMKYITITAKHHDGFAMFESNASKYNIVDATPYGKDIMKALAEECHQQGLKLCFYYSQSQDWFEPNGNGNDWDFPKERYFQKYLDEKVKPQLTELLTNYGPVGLIWFDTPVNITIEQAQDLKSLVRRLQPECIISGRLGGGIVTDYMSARDNIIPATVVSGDWEVPVTFNNTWGFKKNDHTWKSPKAIILQLFDIAAKGGNYLLNVGPNAEGLIPQESVDILSKVGNWMKINSESIYGTQASPFKVECSWGNITQKTGKLYLGIFNWPADGLYLEGLINRVKKVYLLADKQQKILPFKDEFNKIIDHHRLKIELPKQIPNQIVPVVVVEIEGPANVETAICQKADKTILLPGVSALVQNDGKPAELKYTVRGGGADWSDEAINLTWNFKVEKAGTYQIDIVTLETGTAAVPVWQGGHLFKLISSGQEVQSTIADNNREPNQQNQHYKKVHSNGGKLTYGKPGNYQLSLVPVKILKGGTGFTFQEINLLPIE